MTSAIQAAIEESREREKRDSKGEACRSAFVFREALAVAMEHIEKDRGGHHKEYCTNMRCASATLVFARIEAILRGEK